MYSLYELSKCAVDAIGTDTSDYALPAVAETKCCNLMKCKIVMAPADFNRIIWPGRRGRNRGPAEPPHPIALLYQEFTMICFNAIRSDCAKCLRAVRSNMEYYDVPQPTIDAICFQALLHASYECMKYALANGATWPSGAACIAMSHDDDDATCLRFVLENGAPYDKRAFYTAVKSGNTEFMRVLRDMRCEIGKKSYRVAIRNHNVAALRFIVEYSMPRNVDGLRVLAVIDNSVNCLSYLLKIGGPPSELTIGQMTVAAVDAGNMECQRMLYDHGAYAADVAMERAVWDARTESLAFALSHGAEWDTFTCSRAAEYDRLPSLMFAREHGCPWDVHSIIAVSISRNSVQCLDYVCRTGTTDGIDMAPLMLFAIRRAAYECFWYIKNTFNVEITPAFTRTLAAYDNVDYMRFMYKTAPETVNDPRLYEVAVWHGHLELMEYLHTIGCPRPDGLDSIAIERGHMHCLKFIQETSNRPNRYNLRSLSAI